MKKIIVIISIIILIGIIYLLTIGEKNSVKNPDQDKILKVVEEEVYKDIHREEDREQYIDRVIQLKGTVEKVDVENRQLIFEAAEGKIVVILQKDQNIEEVMREDEVVVRGIGVLDEEDYGVIKLVTAIIVKKK